MKTFVVITFAPSLLGLFLLSCSDPDLCEGPQCAAGGDGGAGDATLSDGSGSSDGAKDAGNQGDAYVAPPGCSTTMDLSPQAACVTEQNGVFVSAAASKSSATGSKAAPYATIADAIRAATTAKPNIFVCAGSYDEQVMVTTNVSLYGGFSCKDWSYSSSNLAKVAPTAQGYALELANVSGNVIEDLEFDAPSAMSAGGSSTAVFSNSAMNVHFTRVTARAGNAAAQADAGATPANYDGGSAPVGATPTGTAGVSTVCPPCLLSKDSSSGGTSGSASAAGSAGTDGAPKIVGTPGGAGGTYSNGCVSPGTGASTTAASGGPGSADSGALTASGWVPTTSIGGGTAAVAQGGGGGAGSMTMAGSAGGCGGCGGAGGTPGLPGGSSFAVLSFSSSLTFDACTIAAGTPTGGAAGGAGQPGQSGGFGGALIGSCQGGNGGNGGSGGGGGGGAGGLSVAVGYAGMPPSISKDSTLTFDATPAPGGGAGTGGMPAAGSGASGVGAATLDLSK